MALVPDASLNVGGAVVEVQTAEKWPSKTYVMNIDGERITGTMTDDIEAVKQAIYKILNTERYQYPIYSWNYGVELADLFGKPIARTCCQRFRDGLKKPLLRMIVSLTLRPLNCPTISGAMFWPNSRLLRFSAISTQGRK